MSLETLIDENRQAIVAEPVKAKAVSSSIARLAKTELSVD